MRTYQLQNHVLEKHSHLVRGFTIIEMMVSLALFTIVMTIATGAFLSLIGGNSQLQGEQSIMTSLNFAMDSMTREIRTGTRYYCLNGADTELDATDVTSTVDCPRGQDTFSFVESGNSLSGGSTGGRIAYYIDQDANGVNHLMRKVGTQTPQSLLSGDVLLSTLTFYVSGAKSLGDLDTRQPTVTIIMQAKDPNDTSRTYTLETTVTQRELDI